MFFFNKKIVYMLSVSNFMANTLNSIIKFMMCFFLYLNVSIFHSASAALLLLLHAVLTFLMKLSQFQTSSSSFILLIFFSVYIHATPSLSWANTVMILLSIAITLLLLRNNQIPLHQSSNFVWLLLNYPRFRTMLFGITAYAILLCTTNIGAVDISSDAGCIALFLFKV